MFKSLKKNIIPVILASVIISSVAVDQNLIQGQIFQELSKALGLTTTELTCDSCQELVKVARNKLLSSTAFNDFFGALRKQTLVDACTSFNVTTAEVCTKLYDLNWPIIGDVLKITKADDRTMCGMIPEASVCDIEQPDFNWSITIDNDKKLLEVPKSKVPQRTKDELTIIHLSDIHYDSKYLPDSLAECKELLCCRTMPTSDIPEAKKAGYWSDYRGCNTPLHTVKNALEHIRKTYTKIDYIYMTGDVVAQDVWNSTRLAVREEFQDVYDLIIAEFDGVQVFPIVGNHDTHPVNIFSYQNLPESSKNVWVYEDLWVTWKRWLPKSTKETILKGGYYTVSPKPGFRIIALNNIDCYILNWWIYVNGSTVSRPQLEWLHDTLLAAEKAKEYVHILLHIPSGSSDCITVWSREFNRIVERFSSLIGGIFSGHEHIDALQLHYSQNGHAMAITWNAGSLTTNLNKNPNYKLYKVHPETYEVSYQATWIFDLTEANAQRDKSQPMWFREYHFGTNLSPNGIDMWLNALAKNPNSLRKRWRYQVTSADPALSLGCNTQCLLDNICILAVSVFNIRTHCERFQKILNEALAQNV